MTTTEATDVALLLRAGSLAAPMEIIEERTVGPSLGADNIAKGFNSTLCGFIAIALFMMHVLLLFGLISTLALWRPTCCCWWPLLSLLQATLTLPGMAAIALTLGMAIDSNVLINERIREELRNGISPQAAIHAGYERAFGTILDSNITTLIAGLALFWLRLRPGARLRRGVVPRHPDLDLQRGGDLARGRQSDLRLTPPAGETGDREHLVEIGINDRGALAMEFFKIRKDIPFMRHALVFNVISLITFLLAVFFLATKGLHYSIEFTGGTVMELTYDHSAEIQDIRNALEKGGYADASVQNFGTSRDVLVRLPLKTGQSSADLSKKVMDTLSAEDKGVQLHRVEFVGPQVGRELADNGALALVVVCLGIMAYLALRFEWRFAVAAIIANLHDVVIILGCFAFFQWEFSLPVLAAVLAVLGYSVNESVVIFDRVRENFRKMRKASVTQIIDNAITSTMSRTIITHGCTQAMVLSMLLFGGAALHYFALALTIGILFGIYSSVLVMAPIVKWLGVSREQFIRPVKKDKQEAVV